MPSCLTTHPAKLLYIGWGAGSLLITNPERGLISNKSKRDIWCRKVWLTYIGRIVVGSNVKFLLCYEWICVDSAQGCNKNNFIKSSSLLLLLSLSFFSFFFFPSILQLPGSRDICLSICSYPLYLTTHISYLTHPPPWRLVKTATSSRIHLNLRIEMLSVHGFTGPSPSRGRLVWITKCKAVRKNVVKHKDYLPVLVLDNFQPPTFPVTPKIDAIWKRTM